MKKARLPYMATVSFDGNGAVGGSTKQLLVEERNFIIFPANGFVRPGFRFVCWNTSADGTGANWFPGERLLNSYRDNFRIMYFAVWESLKESIHSMY